MSHIHGHSAVQGNSSLYLAKRNLGLGGWGRGRNVEACLWQPYQISYETPCEAVPLFLSHVDTCKLDVSVFAKRKARGGIIKSCSFLCTIKAIPNFVCNGSTGYEV